MKYYLLISYVLCEKWTIASVFLLSLLSDIDECIASAGVCDVNANCQNSLGSYLCSCKVGYSGDGKTCIGSYRASGLPTELSKPHERGRIRVSPLYVDFNLCF